MGKKTDQAFAARRRVRNLRRARRYLAANEGSLARLLTTYADIASRDPQKAFLSDA